MPPDAPPPTCRTSSEGVRFDPTFEKRLRFLGLLSPSAPATFDAGSLVALSSEREVWRIADADPPLFVKRRRDGAGERGRRSRDPWFKRWLSPRWRGTPSAIAWDLLVALRKDGFDVSAPVAEGGAAGSWFLVTAELPGTDLATWLEDAPEDRRQAILAGTGRLLSRLAAAGWWFPDFVGKHVHVLPSGGLGMIDVDRMVRRAIGPSDRMAMAADLLCTVPDHVLGVPELSAFLSGAFPASPPVREILTAVRDRRTRRRLRRFLAPRPNRWLADRRLDTKGSVWCGEPPASADLDHIRVGADSITLHGRRCDIIHDDSAHLLRAFEALEQLWRVGVSSQVPVGLLVTGERAALVVEPANGDSSSLPEFATRAPERAGKLVATLHQSGLLARNLEVSAAGRVTTDGRALMRPDPIRDSTLRRDLREILDGLPEATHEPFQRAYDSAVRSRLEDSFGALNNPGGT